jgi:hypothetical protein
MIDEINSRGNECGASGISASTTLEHGRKFKIHDLNAESATNLCAGALSTVISNVHATSVAPVEWFKFPMPHHDFHRDFTYTCTFRGK